MLSSVRLSVKQNLRHVWFLKPHILGKLMLSSIHLSVKQNLSYVWFLGPHTLGKSTPNLLVKDDRDS